MTDSLNEAIEDIASLCIREDVWAHAEKLANELSVEYITFSGYKETEYYEPPDDVEDVSTENELSDLEWF